MSGISNEDRSINSNCAKRDEQYEDNAVQKMITGGTVVIIAGMLAGLIGWIVTVFVSRPDIGIGASGYALLSTANSMIIIILAISGGINQSISKYVAESLVDSNESALEHIKASSFATNIFGLIIFAVFLIFSIFSYLNFSYIYATIFLFVGLAILFSFIRDNLIGILAGFQKFKAIGITNLSGILGGITMTLSIFYVPAPINRITFISQVAALPLVQFIFALFFTKRVIPFKLISIYKLPSSFNSVKKICKYGFYCTIPQVILGGSIFWIQTFYYQLFFAPDEPIVGIAGIIIGYASMAGVINLYGWPQIPAVSEAKALNNQSLIDKLVSQCFKTGFNVSILLSTFYIGLSHPLLELFHTAEYLPGYIPFILLSIAITLIGLVFLIASMLIGLGNAKKAFIFISIIIICAFALTPTFIYLFSTFGDKNLALLSGPLGLLIPTMIVFPFLFKYLTKYTNKTNKFFISILLKGSISMATATIISYFIENYVFPYNTFWNWLPIGFIIGIFVNMGIFIFLICFLAGLDNKDWDLFGNILGPLKFLIILPKWISKKSPFYKKREDYEKINTN
ncbi:MAG: hypothetical protein ACTSPY_05450 [Candidatus Helarchaeota archaeon]